MCIRDSNNSDLKFFLHVVVSYALLRIDFLSDGKYEVVYFKNIGNGWVLALLKDWGRSDVFLLDLFINKFETRFVHT